MLLAIKMSHHPWGEVGRIRLIDTSAMKLLLEEDEKAVRRCRGHLGQEQQSKWSHDCPKSLT